MHIRLLGTAAAEGWPAVFCRCEPCNRARAAGGKNIRTRSGANVDRTFQFDFGPDAYHHVLQGNDLSSVEHVIFTHSHFDHLALGDLDMRYPPFAHGATEKVGIWANDAVLRKFGGKVANAERLGLAFHELRPFEPVAVADANLTPLLADHDKNETCLIHIFERGGHCLLYGHDTGIFPEPTWEYLSRWAAQGHRLDVVLLDCTNGPSPAERTHMGLDACARVRGHLVEIGAGTKDTRFIVTHFSHNGGLLHDELVERAAPMGLEVAYDGLEIQTD